MKTPNSFLFILLLTVLNVAHAEPLQVISNKMGNTPGFSRQATNWFLRNQATLPANYYQQAGFIHYEPILPYLDNVNWSLFSLRQFKSFSKDRWVRVPAGQKIQRDAKTGAWSWPVGSETAKLIRAQVRANGTDTWQNIELRMARKIQNGSDPRGNWAMAVFVPSASGWSAAQPGHLTETVQNAITPNNAVRAVNYVLTDTDACMTCHLRGAGGTVDYHRGSEFVYGANNELLTGRTRMRLTQYASVPAIKGATKVLGQDAANDWVDLELNDSQVAQNNKKIFAPIIQGDIP